jgi:hypothetical protein
MKQPLTDTATPTLAANARRRRATWSLTRYDDLEQMKADEYRFWQSQPGHVRIAAISQLTAEQYAMKGQHVRRLQRTLVRLATKA